MWEKIGNMVVNSWRIRAGCGPVLWGLMSLKIGLEETSVIATLDVRTMLEYIFVT